MVNIELLKQAISFRGVLLKDFLPKIGLSKRMWQIRAERRTFTRDEIVKIKEVLNLSTREFFAIFFPEFVTSEVTDE